jgi:hypothetical protein
MVLFFIDIWATQSMLAITDPNRSNPMARRTRKSAALPVKQNATAAAVVHRFKELPGAVFFGTLFRSERRQFSITRQHGENLDDARCLQRIRDDFEMDGCEEMLWADCMEMGFNSRGHPQVCDEPGPDYQLRLLPHDAGHLAWPPILASKATKRMGAPQGAPYRHPGKGSGYRQALPYSHPALTGELF